MKKIALGLLLLSGFIFANETNVLSSNSGRYVFGQVSQMRADQYLLDTKTGRMWHMVADKDNNLSLVPMAIENMVFKDGKYVSVILDAPTER